MKTTLRSGFADQQPCAAVGEEQHDRRGAVELEKLPPAQARHIGPQPGVPGPCSELCGAGRGLAGPAENFSWVKLHPVEPGRRHGRAHPRMNHVDPN